MAADDLVPTLGRQAALFAGTAVSMCVISGSLKGMPLGAAWPTFANSPISPSPGRGFICRYSESLSMISRLQGVR
ncbi:hypothetical protein [Bradyrhizobium macuxiense]|uniref:hypothetical protein n=1 Tax=Bradyrhizobium macuxiense TaxID=1755647 RepID=UPI0010A979E1|nr:hypothetical protein [Bradyrhizobium macuxiense]